MLTISGVTVRYGATTAVDLVDLEVPTGEVLALLGPSGCGKSTLLRAVAGLEPLATGKVSWNAQDLKDVPVHRRGIGLIFQDGVLFPHRSVAGNVGYGMSGGGRAARVTEMLELVGLAGFGDRAVASLSGGQAQRVALARALAPRPRVLLLDEPLAALDRAWRDKLAAELRELLRQTGTTALFVTHDQDEAFALADRIAVMRDGRIVQVGRPEEVWSAPSDDWVAGFLGYSTVVEVEHLLKTHVTDGVAAAGSGRAALRTASLLVSPDGSLAGWCLTALPGPDLTALTVQVPGLGVVPASATDRVEPGDPVRLAVNWAAVGWVGGSRAA